MKLFTLILALLMTGTVFAQGGYIDSVGTKVKHQSFIVVKNSAAEALTVGEVVCADLTDDDVINVDFCSFAGAKPLCVIQDTSCAVGARCKCLSKGYASVRFNRVAGKNATPGDVLYATLDGSVYAIVQPTTAATLSAVRKHDVAVALDAATATATLEVYFDP